jgi:hypothetical protein
VQLILSQLGPSRTHGVAVPAQQPKTLLTILDSRESLADLGTKRRRTYRLGARELYESFLAHLVVNFCTRPFPAA